MKPFIKRIKRKLEFLLQIPFQMNDFRTIQLATTLFGPLAEDDQELALIHAQKFASQPRRLFHLSFWTHFLPVTALLLFGLALAKSQVPTPLMLMFLEIWLITAALFFFSKAKLLFHPVKRSSSFYLYMLRRVCLECPPRVKMQVLQAFSRHHSGNMLHAVLPKLRPYINQEEGKVLLKSLEGRKLKTHFLPILKPFLLGNAASRVLDPTELGKLLKSYDWQSRQVQFSTGGQLYKVLREQYHTAEEIEQVLGCQADLLRSPEQLYCMACLTRAQLQRHHVWKWLICPTCELADQLQNGIIKVIGQLPDAGERRLENGVLWLPLWSSHEKTAIVAEVDELRVGNGTESRWALAAFLQKLNNIPLLARSRFELVLAHGQELDAELWHALKPHIDKNHITMEEANRLAEE